MKMKCTAVVIAQQLFTRNMGQCEEGRRAGAPSWVAEWEGSWPGAPADDLIHVPALACGTALSRHRLGCTCIMLREGIQTTLYVCGGTYYRCKV